MPPFHSPLRYPGSKRRLFPFVAKLLEDNDLLDVQYVEPCAGGASLALALLYNEYAESIYLNDLSFPLFAFWYGALKQTDRFCDKIEHTPVTMDEWQRQRTIYRNHQSTDLFSLGFATFFLNRTNHSGIIDGGVLGGKHQDGDVRIDARYNKVDLIERIRRLGRFRSRIFVYRQDALDFTNNIVSRLGDNVLAFYDPPYIEKGNTLYLNNYSVEDHQQLAARIQALSQPWIVTYDYEAAQQHGLFAGQRCLDFSISYSAQDRYLGREAMFLSDHLMLPSEWEDNEPVVMSSGGQAQIMGRLQG